MIEQIYCTNSGLKPIIGCVVYFYQIAEDTDPTISIGYHDSSNEHFKEIKEKFGLQIYNHPYRYQYAWYLPVSIDNSVNMETWYRFLMDFWKAPNLPCNLAGKKITDNFNWRVPKIQFEDK